MFISHIILVLEIEGGLKMNQNGIYTTLAERAALPLKEYSFPTEAGSFQGRLDFRVWSKRTPALHCYFTTTVGKKICLPVYFENNYRPKEEGPSFDYVEDGSIWECEYVMSRNGTTRWIRAKKLEG